MAKGEPLTEVQRSLVEENRGLIDAGVKEYGRRCGWKLSRDDLTLEFGLALCRAARTFDGRRGAFSSWAFWWFYSTWMGMLQDYFRRGVSAPRGTKVFYLDIPEMSSKRADVTGNKDDVTIETMDTERSREEWRKEQRAVRLVEMREEYAMVRGLLNEREQEVLDHVAAGMPLKEVGRKLGMSKQGAGWIKRHAIEVLQRAIRQREHESIKDLR